MLEKDLRFLLIHFLEDDDVAGVMLREEALVIEDLERESSESSEREAKEEDLQHRIPMVIQST